MWSPSVNFFLTGLTPTASIRRYNYIPTDSPSLKRLILTVYPSLLWYSVWKMTSNRSTDPKGQAYIQKGHNSITWIYSSSCMHICFFFSITQYNSISFGKEKRRSTHQACQHTAQRLHCTPACSIIDLHHHISYVRVATS